MAICLCIYFLPCTAYAASTADANEPIITSAACSLTLNYAHNGSAFSDLKVQLYCVATISSDFQFSLADVFQETSLTINGVSSIDEWAAMRNTFESYIVANQIAPDSTKNTDDMGSVTFGSLTPDESLTPGMYFVMPVRFSDNGVYYNFDSALIAVPGLGENGSWVYDVAAAPKPDVVIPTWKYENYKVIKLWSDNGDSNKRPAFIEADIICNGEIKETVILSAENNWSYSWTTVDNGDIWHVVERNVPEGYIMTVEEHATSFTIINTIPDTSDQTDVAGDKDTPDDDDPPEVAGDKDTIDDDDSPKTGDTTNIGLYVMLMCFSGLTLVILGATARRKTE